MKVLSIPRSTFEVASA
jgi:hypothetical protein